VFINTDGIAKVYDTEIFNIKGSALHQVKTDGSEFSNNTTK
jgi:hypothetical protein